MNIEGKILWLYIISILFYLYLAASWATDIIEGRAPESEAFWVILALVLVFYFVYTYHKYEMQGKDRPENAIERWVKGGS